MLVNLDLGSPFAFEALTIGSAATYLSNQVYSRQGLPAKRAMVQAGTGSQIRYRIDGVTDVTSSVGHILNPLDALMVEGISAIMKFNTISVLSGTNGAITVTYFR